MRQFTATGLSRSNCQFFIPIESTPNSFSPMIQLSVTSNRDTMNPKLACPPWLWKNPIDTTISWLNRAKSEACKRYYRAVHDALRRAFHPCTDPRKPDCSKCGIIASFSLGSLGYNCINKMKQGGDGNVMTPGLEALFKRGASNLAASCRKPCHGQKQPTPKPDPNNPNPGVPIDP